MFPIRNVKGQVIGFGGRVLDGGEPKYLNSPETPLFNKGSELYGLFEARLAIREQHYVLAYAGTGPIYIPVPAPQTPNAPAATPPASPAAQSGAAG